VTLKRDGKIAKKKLMIMPMFGTMVDIPESQ
jgi:hypothetical protein